MSAPRESWLAYLLLVFLGGLGVHRFYLGHNGVGAVLLILTLVGWATSWLLVGFGPLAVVFVWLLVDLFAIPSYVATANERRLA